MNGGYPLYKVNQFEDFRACLHGVAEMYGERPLFVTYDAQGTEHMYTYRAFADDVQALSASLKLLGLGEGRHVALVGENSYHWLVSLFAITTIGSVAVTIDVEQSDDVIKAMVWRADADAVICSEGFTDMFLSLQGEYPALRHVISKSEDARDEVLSFCKLLEDGRLRTWMEDTVSIDPDQPAMIVYTSGTTSISKPVLLSHRNMLSNGCNAAAMVSMGPKVYVSLPLYHSYGLTAGVMAHLTQGLVICVNGNIKTMLRDIKLFEPTSITAVPLIIEAIHGRICAELNKRGEIDRARAYMAARKGPAPTPGDMSLPYRGAVHEVLGPNIRMMVSGGAHLNVKVAGNMETLGIQVIEGYGITECSPMISANRNGAEKLGTVGVMMPDMEVRIVDGEIHIRGVSVSRGYYKDEELTAEYFQDGWFLTGDLGFMDKDGFLTINGRKKTLIVFKNGKKVTPEEIEGYVADIPLIQEAMAYGVSNGTSSDDVKLALMVYPNPQLTEGMGSYEILQRLQAQINEINRKLPTYKQIQSIKLRDVPFEKTSLRKIKRYVV